LRRRVDAPGPPTIYVERMSMTGRTRPAGGAIPRPRDLALALGIGTVVTVITLIAAGHQPLDRPLDWLAWLLVWGGAGSLAFRRRWPAAVLVVAGACAVAYYNLGYPGGPAGVPVFVALFSAAVLGHRLVAVAGAIGIAVLVATAGALFDGRLPTVASFGAAGWVAMPVIVGEVARSRRARVAAIQERALEAERTREQEAQRRADEERLRIARELHDVLAHSISMINVQAGVAAHLLDSDTEQARTALIAIKAASKDALRELRATLGVLRSVDESAPLTPAPGLARLEELVAGATGAGLVVEVTVEGEPRPLPAGTDLAAYRIVQEALTNVLRHAGPASAAVRVVWGPSELEVEVTDDGSGPAPGTPLEGGNGLTGMRERAAAAGGRLEAGPGPDGGFRVRAVLPVPAGVTT
jgi:signal transduction histidine kinase